MPAFSFKAIQGNHVFEIYALTSKAAPNGISTIWLNTKYFLLSYFYYILPSVLGMTLNCIHIFIVTGSLLY